MMRALNWSSSACSFLFARLFFAVFSDSADAQDKSKANNPAITQLYNAAKKEGTVTI